MNALRTLCAVCAVVMVAAGAGAGIIHVPADQPTIQMGITAAASGETVLVACGTY